MSFPHPKRIEGTSQMRQDFRALISKSISQQGNSLTARLMLEAEHLEAAAPASKYDALDERIRYFAASPLPIGSEATPHGAFFSGESRNFKRAGNYDRAVYQDGLATGKNQSVYMSVSETQTTHPGQEN